MAVNDFTGENIQDTYQRVVQTDGTRLADGTGSLLPISFDGNNVIVSGSITAQTYVVSESITNISSGSTIFGNSSDDVHQITGSMDYLGNLVVHGKIKSKGSDVELFKGDITASGDISASGKFIGNEIKFKDDDTRIKFVNDNLNIKSDNGRITIVGNITSSHISASGLLKIKEMHVEQHEFLSKTGDDIVLGPQGS